jgi:environmental stress-induced protein Ves
MRIIRAADLVRVPWKNGGGTTAEVAAFPVGSTFDTFGWRISMADVSEDGPFSAFPGIDRTLIVTAGDGIVLDVDGKAHALRKPGSLLRFAGDAHTEGRLVSGPIRDLNIMTRRGAFTHTASVSEFNDETLPPIGGTRAVVLIEGSASLDGTTDLAPLDCVLLDPEDTPPVIPGRGLIATVSIS